MHHNESIISDQQSTTAPVSVDNSTITTQHYQHSHQPSQPQQQQHVGIMSTNAQAKLESIDYNLHRVNEPSTMYNQMVRLN